MWRELVCRIGLFAVLCALPGVACADLVAYWPLDEGAGDIVGDRTGTWNGTITGDVTWVEGKVGAALAFPGGDNYVDFGNVQIGASMTLAYWCYNPEKAYERPIGQHSGDYTTDPGWVVLSRNEGEGGVWFRVHGADDAWDGGDIVITDILTKTEWYHLAFTFDGPTRELSGYLNGELKATKICEAGRTILGTDNDLRLGNVGTAEAFSGMLDDIAIWDTALTAEEVLEVFLLGPEVIDPAQAGAPDPEDEAIDVPRDTTLNWTSGIYAGKHDVYFGSSRDDVNDASRANPLNVLVSQGQDARTYDPGRLEFNRAYYWRVDEVNATPDNTIIRGRVWSFMTEPLAYPIAGVVATSNATSEAGTGPENTVNGSGLNDLDEHSTNATDMWLGIPAGADPTYIQYEFDRVYKLHEMLVWNYNVQFELMLGFGLKDVTVEYSTDGQAWSALADVPFAQGTASGAYTHNTTVDLGGVAARYVRLTVNSGYGMMGRFGLSEVRFTFVPAHARGPQPADGATGVSVDGVLSWRAGREAASHMLYFSADEGAVAADGTALVDTVTESSYPCASLGLEFGSTYYWKVNEVNESEIIATWEGDVWSLTTQEYAVIDDFESYTDDLDAGEAIFQTWIDGWVNETGSTVGHFEAPFAEKSIVNSGMQSMPLEYNNTTSPFYSEAERDLGLQDWTVGGADTLRLAVRGNADNDPGPLYVVVADSAGLSVVVPHPDPQITLTTVWQEWSIGLSEIRSGGVNLARIKTLTIGVGDRESPAAGGRGLIYIDDIGFGRPAPVEGAGPAAPQG